MGRGLIVVAVAAALVAVVSPAAWAGADRARTGARPAQLTQQRASGSKLDSRVARVSHAANAGVLAAAREARRRGLAMRGSRTRVVIERRRGTALQLLGAVVRRGGVVEGQAPGLIQALIPVRALASLARTPLVRIVRTPLRQVLYAVNGEEVQAANAAAWQSSGLSGLGVKVGIVDGGFGGYQSRQASGDLPQNVVTLDFCSGHFNDEPHGAAVAEIVHEMAPGAQLFLVCAETEVDFAQAVEWARAQGVTIINHSAGFPGQSRGDGSDAAGRPDTVIAAAKAAGVLWVNAAGNHGDQHWSGMFVD